MNTFSLFEILLLCSLINTCFEFDISSEKIRPGQLRKFYKQFEFCINFLPPDLLHPHLIEELEFVDLFLAFLLPQLLDILNLLSHTGFEFLHFLKNPKICLEKYCFKII